MKEEVANNDVSYISCPIQMREAHGGASLPITGAMRMANSMFPV